ncbi:MULTISPECIES: PleD family two-component system response regulator [Trichocoleus]|uniref:response regulator n=1 Tax=Trichocoleus TaxID=450526 RepID=UPI0016874A3F|nr:response regulator [Trichocoleus sp. FACHB-262]MBD2124706.1 response regulator [Trichocoleus sp. FACHB-262]
MASHKILVIDDSRVIRMRVRDMLPKGNFEVLEAKDGVEGLNLIRQERPNLIMLDFLLPRMSGWEVFQQIQNQSDLQSIPLVVMSGRREEVTEKIPEPFEFFEFIEKPFEQKELIEAIKASMAKAKLPRVQAAAPTVATPAATTATAAPAESGASAAEIQALNEKIAKMQAEIDGLKKQLTQIVTFIKQKLK